MTLSDPAATEPTMREAASVVLYRRDPLEVFLVRRPVEARFFPDHWSLPGGTVDEEDGPLGQMDTWRRTALRELGEELGIDTSEVDPDELVPAGHAVTPPFHTIRFDAMTFLLEARDDWEPVVDLDELAEGGWFEPKDVIARWDALELKLPPPILYVMRAMSTADPIQRMAAHRDLEHKFPIELGPGLRIVPIETATLPPARYTNCMVVGRKDLAIIDPGATGDALEPLYDLVDHLIHHRGAKVGTVILTHHHADHAAGAAEVAARYDVEVAAHRETAKRLDDGLVDFTFGEGKEVALDADTPDEIVLEALHTPGHAPGHLAFLVRPHNVLLAGDLVATSSTILIDPREGDMAEYMESLVRCADLKPSAVYPAHGPPTLEGVRLLMGTLEHRIMREERVVEALRGEPRTIDELVEEVYADTPQEAWGLARLSLSAHLRKLEHEGRARHEPAGWVTGVMSRVEDEAIAEANGAD